MLQAHLTWLHYRSSGLINAIFRDNIVSLALLNFLHKYVKILASTLFFPHSIKLEVTLSY